MTFSDAVLLVGKKINEIGSQCVETIVGLVYSTANPPKTVPFSNTPDQRWNETVYQLNQIPNTIVTNVEAWDSLDVVATNKENFQQIQRLMQRTYYCKQLNESSSKFQQNQTFVCQGMNDFLVNIVNREIHK